MVRTSIRPPLSPARQSPAYRWVTSVEKWKQSQAASMGMLTNCIARRLPKGCAKEPENMQPKGTQIKFIEPAINNCFSSHPRR